MRYMGAVLAVAFVPAVPLFACSSSNKEVTSLDSNKTLASLTTDERRQLCEDRFHYLSSRASPDDRKKIACSAAAGVVGPGGSFDTGRNTARAREACTQVFRACMSAPPPEQQSGCDAFPKDAEGCAATVGDVSGCAEAQADALEELAAKAEDTCTNPGRASERRKDASTKAQHACAGMRRLCPQLFQEPALGNSQR